MPQSRTACLRHRPSRGRSRSLLFYLPVPCRIPGVAQVLRVTPTWPPSCLLPATRQGKAGLQAAGAGRRDRPETLGSARRCKSGTCHPRAFVPTHSNRGPL